jgi:D-tyrosyl-tRNA(Tyr) deacylase
VRVVIQRVQEASVTIENSIVGEVGLGLLVLLGIEESDTLEDIDYLVKKLNQLRIFSDAEGKMNASIQDVDGSFLVVSQFTLHASSKKGNRPSFIRAAHPDQAIPLYNVFISALNKFANVSVETGEFGADMKVRLLNDGPVTLLLDSKEKSF